MFILLPIIFIVLYAIINILVINKLFNIFKDSSKINKPIFFIIVAILNNSYLLFLIFEKFIPISLRHPIAVVSSYILSYFIYLILFFGLAYILSRFIHKIDFFKPAIILSLIVVLIGTFLANSAYVEKYNITTNKQIKKEYKIALVSDIHLGYILGSNNLSKMVDEINKLDADIVVLAGDIIDSNLQTVLDNNMLSSLKNLQSNYGTYVTLGNHDGYAGHIDSLAKELNKYNVKLLRNEHILIDNSIYIIGRDDSSINSDNKFLSNKLKSLDNNKITITVDHDPKRISESVDNNIDVQLSGHTHNGQLLPFNIVTNMLFEVSNGYKKINNTNIIVSSGYGTWGPPIRTSSRSQIVLITLHN